MVVIRKDGKGEEIDSKLAGEVPESLLNPFFAMVVIDAGQRILSEEPTSADRTVENVEDLNFGGVNDLTPRLSNHANVS